MKRAPSSSDSQDDIEHVHQAGSSDGDDVSVPHGETANIASSDKFHSISPDDSLADEPQQNSEPIPDDHKPSKESSEQPPRDNEPAQSIKKVEQHVPNLDDKEHHLPNHEEHPEQHGAPASGNAPNDDAPLPTSPTEYHPATADAADLIPSLQNTPGPHEDPQPISTENTSTDDDQQTGAEHTDEGSGNSRQEFRRQLLEIGHSGILETNYFFGN